jgi:hypothetical protein
MFDCNVRADTIILWQLGLQDAARLRMVCFGADLTRKAYEAAGGVCPQAGTAEGIQGAPVMKSMASVAPAPVATTTPMPASQPQAQPIRQGAAMPASQAEPAQSMPKPVIQAVSSTPPSGVSHGRINQDGSVTWN